MIVQREFIKRERRAEISSHRERHQQSGSREVYGIILHAVLRLLNIYIRKLCILFLWGF